MLFFGRTVTPIQSTTPSRREEKKQIEQLIAGVASGSREAMEQLYLRVHGPVYGFVLSITKNPQDAEDVVSDLFIRLYDVASTYQPEGKPMAWLFSIARNLALMKLRSSKRNTHLTAEEWEAFPYEGERVTPEERLLLAEAMTGLSEEERQILMLHAAAGFKHREIASLLELPLPTVLSKYHRAIKKLSRKFEEE
ncbi:MAG: RNA polymerase sigma factor [Ruminococcaceae bacterium]|nr:RNA polymerase sigma factor [Oscillospiraceae bacterium]